MSNSTSDGEGRVLSVFAPFAPLPSPPPHWPWDRAGFVPFDYSTTTPEAGVATAGREELAHLCIQQPVVSSGRGRDVPEKCLSVKRAKEYISATLKRDLLVLSFGWYDVGRREGNLSHSHLVVFIHTADWLIVFDPSVGSSVSPIAPFVRDATSARTHTPTPLAVG